jgi:hypothetical protein
MDHHSRDADTREDEFPRDPSGLPEATPPRLLQLDDGDAFDLRIAPVAK